MMLIAICSTAALFITLFGLFCFALGRVCVREADYERGLVDGKARFFIAAEEDDDLVEKTPYRDDLLSYGDMRR
jgi:hypothetical protein